LINNYSSFLILETLPPSFLETPNNVLKRKNLIFKTLNTSGKWPGTPITFPTNLSFLVKVGSISRPTPIKPPGVAYNNSLSSAARVLTLEKRGLHIVSPF